MAELETLARPYARAAFEYAVSSKALGAWYEQLSLAASAVKTEEMDAFLANPSVTSKQRAAVLSDVCGDQISPEFKNLVGALSENDRLPLLPAILDLFDELKQEHEKTIDVEIASAFELEPEQQQRLVAALEKKLGREVQATTVVDATLIGGVVVHAGDMVIDGSAKGRLAKLSETMSS